MNNKIFNEFGLVSVAVISYNSEKTILDTLKSVDRQSYPNEKIQVVISDDRSSDETITIIHRWAESNRKKFYEVLVLESNENVGVSGNCTKAWKKCKGDWIKTIAADDILLSDCIESNIKFIRSKSPIIPSVVFSKVQVFSETVNGVNLGRVLPTSAIEEILEKSAEVQNKYLMTSGIPLAPSAFINRRALEKIGYADERFKLIEDHPLWYRLTRQAHKLFYYPEITVRYRISDSLSNSREKLINLAYYREIINIEERLILPDIPKKYKLFRLRKRLWPRLVIFISIIFFNKRNFFSKSALWLAMLIKPKHVRLGNQL